jgi:hypothetical protein
MGWYDPRGFLDGCAFLTDTDKGKILGQNAARLLKITARLKSMGGRAPRATGTRRGRARTRARKT